MLSQKKKNIINSIDLLFKGLDDDVLKEVMLAVALNKSEEEKDKIIEEIKQKKEEDMQDITNKFHIVIDKDHPMPVDMSSLVFNGTTPITDLANNIVEVDR